MAYEQMWVLIGLIWMVAGTALFIWARHLREAKRLAVREMIHEERLAALEKGVSPGDLSGDLGATDGRGDALDRSRFLRRLSLLTGLVLVCGGLGMAGGFWMLHGDEVEGLHQLAGLGAIPLLVGVGFLLFHWLDRRGAAGGGAA